MRFLFAILMLMAAIAAAANVPDAIRNADDRRGGHRMVKLAAIVAWPTFERSAIGLTVYPRRDTLPRCKGTQEI
jgi:hypothetical protein